MNSFILFNSTCTVLRCQTLKTNGVYVVFSISLAIAMDFVAGSYHFFEAKVSLFVKEISMMPPIHG